MALPAALIPILAATAGGVASGATSAAVTKAGSKKHLPPVTGGTPMMQPVAGSQQNEMVKAILMNNLKAQSERREDKEDKEEAMEEQAKSVAKDVAEAAKR